MTGSLVALRAQATGSREGAPCWQGELGKMAPTLAEADLLYALVRAARPSRVLELGTGRGLSARFIAEALLDNAAGGQLLTVEPHREHWPAAEELLLGLPAQITATRALPGGWEPGEIGLVFIDSEPGLRERDIAEWLSCGYRGLVVVHDALRGYPEFGLGEGVVVPSTSGLWIGRAA